MLPNFVAKVTVDRPNCLLLNGKPVIDEFSVLRSGLVATAGREVAALFAEPVVTPKADQIEIAYYAEQPGEPLPIDALDPDARRIVTDKLKSRLGSIAALLTTELGPLLGRALYVAGTSDILAVGQEPLLIKWGVLPDGLRPDDQAALDAHFAATLGRYAPFGAPIIVPSRPMSAPIRPSAQAPPPQTRLLVTQRSFLGIPAESRPLVIATGIAALAALLLTLPGILAAPAIVTGVDETVLPGARQITKAMQDKVEQARAALGTANCNPDGTIDPGPKDGKQGQLPPPPIPIMPAQGQTQGDLALVARRATESVVFILNCTDRQGWAAQHKDDKEKGTPIACPKADAASSGGAEQSAQQDLVLSSSGSGFFIAPKLVATNTHVVRDAKAVFVTSRFLGHVTPAKVEVATIKVNAADPDFAVVSLDIEHSPPPIELATTAARLQNVVAAGFPGVIIHEDAQLERLLKGDAKAVPELTTFPGFITLTMNQDQAVPLIFSSAVIGHGNSGGPLLDLCARAIGVNTLGWSGDAEDTGYKVNVAEGAKALSAFLDQHHVEHRTLAEACETGPQASNGQPPPSPQPAPPGPTPAPPISQGK